MKMTMINEDVNMENRIVTRAGEIDLSSVKMDALVHDLSEALKESSCPGSSRIKSGFRRRTRSAGNITALARGAAHSDDSMSEKSLVKNKGHGHSDSDEVSANSQRQLTPFPLQKKSHCGNIESDSVNENFSPFRIGARRKRKMKRMDCETADVPIVPHIPCDLSLRLPGPDPCISLPGPSGIRGVVKKKKVPNGKDLGLEMAAGKRKRNTRDRSLDTATTRRMFKSCRLFQQNRDDQMEVEPTSSSSLSSSESDAGLQTNDEGREGDDEQSDWFADPRPDEETDLEPDDPTFQSVFNCPLDQMTSNAKQAYSERIEWLRNDIRSKRRVQDDRQGFSANEMVSKFLQDQDCHQLTLRLHHMENDEREQLVQLVNMYALQMRIEVSGQGETCPVLSKTSATPRSIDPSSFCPNAFKKRRKLPQRGSSMETTTWDKPALRPSETKE